MGGVWMRAELLLLLASGSLGLPAWAAGSPGAPGPGGGDESTAVEPLEGPVSWAAARRWAPMGGTPRTFVDVAGTRHAWLAVDLDGRVWRSAEGQRWRVVLGPATYAETDDEALLLEAEALQEELGRESGQEEDEEGDEGGTAREVADPDELVLLVSASEAAGARPRLWADPRDPARVLLLRADGAWRSLDAGRRWEHVDGPPAPQAVAPGPGARIVAADPASVRVGLEGGRRWVRLDPPEAGHGPVFLSTGADGTLFGIFAGRLFTSPDGERWRATRIAVADPRALLADPEVPGAAFWVDGTLLRHTDDGGATATDWGRVPLPEVEGLRWREAAGTMVAWGGDGVWESVDGGITWRSASRGLSHPVVFGLAQRDGEAILASPPGLHRLVEAAPAGGPAVRSLALRPLRPAQDLVYAALSRPGMDPLREGLVATATWRRRLVPAVEVDLRYRLLHRDAVYCEPLSPLEGPWCTQGWSERETGREVEVWLRLHWGAGAVDRSLEFEAASVDDRPLLFVLDGQIHDTRDQSLASAGARVAKKAATYRIDVQRQVSALAAARERLAAEPPPADLLPAVLHRLRIEEIEALLAGYAGAPVLAEQPPDGGTPP